MLPNRQMIHGWRMRSRLQAYHDLDLPEADRLQVAQHLSGCRDCSQQLALLAELDQRLLDASPGLRPLPAPSADAILERVLAQTSSRRRGWGPWYVLSGTAVAALLIAGFLLLGPDRPKPGVVAKSGGGAKMARRPDARVTTGAVPVARPVLPRRQRAVPAANRQRGRSTSARITRRAPARRRDPSPRSYQLARVDHPEMERMKPAPDATGGDQALPRRSETGETQPQGHLLVVLTRGNPPALVKVRQAPRETPGFARASAYRRDSEGGVTWAQATVRSDTRPAAGGKDRTDVVLLGVERSDVR